MPGFTRPPETSTTTQPAFYVYILECCDVTLYTGYTTDVGKRIHEHNNTAAGARYTRGRRPVVLLYAEEHRTLSDALRQEAQIKKMSRAEKLLFIEGNSSPTRDIPQKTCP